MHRRTLLKTGSLALAGFGVSGCLARSVRTAPSARGARRAPVNLAPVNASLDRVIRNLDPLLLFQFHDDLEQIQLIGLQWRIGDGPIHGNRCWVGLEQP